MRSFGALISIGLLGAATPLLAQTPTAPTQAETPPKSKSSVQQQFEAGTAAINARDWQRAFDIYSALEKTLGTRTPPSKSIGIVRLRKGLTLVKLKRSAEGEAILNAALQEISDSDASLANDRSDALFTLGELAERRYDYPGAITRFRSAMTSTSDAAVKLAAYSHLIPIGIFVDRDAALADADAALVMVAQHPEANKEWPGTLRAMRGRVLMNMGRLKEARADLSKSISQLGGLGTSKINLLDATARSDAAIAALRDNARDEARRYLAYAGATQQADQGFRVGNNMNPPSCGGKNGPKPEDVAVVEFNIREDGSVGVARPIFFSGEPAGAIDFARAVSGWVWRSEDLKEVSPFYRALTRVELRCTVVFAKPNQFTLLVPAVNTWLASQKADFNIVDTSNQASKLQEYNLELVRREIRFGKNSIKLIDPLLNLSFSSLLAAEISKNHAQRAYDIALSVNAPAQVRAFLGLALWRFVDNPIKNAANDPYHLQLSKALTDPVIANDPIASAAIRLAFFDTLSEKNRLIEGAAALKLIIDDASLPAKDPYKVGALTRLASLEFNQGKIEDARSLFAQTGLSSQQCALVDAQPLKTSGKLKVKDYPDSAYQYGFGGWAVVEFDIDSNGATTNQRPIIAWPPFVFGEAVANGIKRFQYQQTYRPEGGLGCSGQRHAQGFRFDRGN